METPEFREEEMIPVMERMYCPKCGTEMEFTGIVLTSYPAQYPHRCPKCDYRYTTYGEAYPIMKYKPKSKKKK